MRRLLVVVLALAAALAACGRVGPPLRSRPEPEAARAEQAEPGAEQDEDSEERHR